LTTLTAEQDMKVLIPVKRMVDEEQPGLEVGTSAADLEHLAAL